MSLYNNGCLNLKFFACETIEQLNPNCLFQFTMAKISVIGSGVIGGVTGRVFSELGHDVIFHDVSDSKLLELKNDGFRTTLDITEAISQTDVSFVCINTPTNSDGEQDLSRLLSSVSKLVTALDAINKYHLVVIRCTILPGTMRSKVIGLFDKHSSKKRGKDYDVCYNPEFLRQLYALEDMKNPDRIIIGEDVKNSALPLIELYKPLTDKIIVTTFEAAEMIKYVSNCFLALKISFFNEIAMICKKLNIDHNVVSNGTSLDKRIGTYGIKASKPFGGTCLPKDTEAFMKLVKKLEINPDLIKTTVEINNMVKKVFSNED